ncbi:MAG: ATP-binding protein [Tannerella sp.]|jgi:hypothetical protein|nr:ATP-binding protein [Tannerella sp.]
MRETNVTKTFPPNRLIVMVFQTPQTTVIPNSDNFGLSPMERQQQLDFLGIIEDRHGRKATIIASQLPVSSWFDVFSDETLADSVFDQMVSLHINLS